MRDRIIIDRETGEEIRIKDVVLTIYETERVQMSVRTGINGIYANIYVDRELYEVVDEKPKIMFDI